MLCLVYSAIDGDAIQSNLGMPEYSYYFVLKEFMPLFKKLGQVQIINDPATEVDVIYEQCQQQGIDCVFFSFSPPHKTNLTLRCPTIPVFAWEFDTLPDEEWENNPNNNWVWCLKKLGSAIVHSNYTVNSVKKQVHPNFPVISLPAPLWDRFAPNREHFNPTTYAEEFVFLINGKIIDSYNFKNFLFKDPFNQHKELYTAFQNKNYQYRINQTKYYLLNWYRDVIRDLLPQSVSTKLSQAIRKLFLRRKKAVIALQTEEQSNSLPDANHEFLKITLKGVIYTSVLNPCDGRKNLFDMIMAFCSVFQDTEDATLILKFTHHNSTWAFSALNETFRKLRPFKCRIIAIHGFLHEEDYRTLIKNTTYVVNTSHAEGQCLPLMEFMACGKPAISPNHTAMNDYICEQVAFIVESNPELCSWPHDTRLFFRAHRFRINYHSLIESFRQSYELARYEPSRYNSMAEHCISRMETHCSINSILPKLRQFISHVTTVNSIGA